MDEQEREPEPERDPHRRPPPGRDLPFTDPVDGILLREARTALTGSVDPRIVVLDDVSGLLSVTMAELGGTAPVRAHCDSLVAELQVQKVARGAGVTVDVYPHLDEAVLAGADLVVLRLPKSLAALDETAEAVARHAAPGVQLLAGGRVKHMTTSMNAVLQQHFAVVRASLGQQKSRVLIAAQPVPVPGVPPTFPQSTHHDDLDLTVVAHGAVFAGTSIDLGTRFLLSFFELLDPAARSVVDLGCGSGVLAVQVSRRLPQAHVLAVDESEAAVRSTQATVAANGLNDRVEVRRGDLLAGVQPGSVDLIVCNPPFHRGSARDSDAAFGMFAAAGGALRPGGELWTVFNSHLPYLNALRRQIGSTQVMGQNPRYLVTRSRR